MPVYEYQCKQCHREFEYQQRMADPDKTVCEACGGALERIMSRTAFQLKGSGWYKDLYSSAKPDAKGADAKAAPTGPALTAHEGPPTAKEVRGDSSGGSSSGGDSGGSSGGGGGSSSGTGGGGPSSGGGSSSGGSSSSGGGSP